MLKKILSLLLFVVLLNNYSFAQEMPQLVGKVVDVTDNSPLIGANVAICTVADTVIKNGISTDTEGRFKFDGIPAGKYLLRVSYISYADIYQTITVTDTPQRLGRIALTPIATELKAVEIKTKAITAIQKSDTTELNTSSYKTNKDATAEELVNKMPGVTIQNGQVQAQGEKVQQVLIDGKPFMGNDPNAALKNLPASVIEKIQIFDRQSDQAQFTGFSDGNTTKTINIITKSTMRNGKFGKVYAGYGTNDLYKAGGNFNYFEKDRKITIVGQSNNINEQNFSQEDLLGVISSSQNQGGGGPGGGGRGQGGPRGGGGGRGMMGPTGGSDVNDFLVTSSNGIAQTHAIGINYADKWGKKADIATSYFFNNTGVKSLLTTNRNFVLGADSGRNYSENSEAKTVNTNHRFNLRLDYKFDTSNSVLITPKVTLQQNTGNSDAFGQNSINSFLLNTTSNNFNSALSGYSLSNTALFRQKFRKAGRTVSFTFTNTHNNNSGDNDLTAQNAFYGRFTGADTLNQAANLLKNGYNLNTNVTYTEPLTAKSSLQGSYTNVYKEDKSDKSTYNQRGGESALDTTLTSVFKSKYISHNAAFGYRYNTQKINLFFNAGLQNATLNNDSQFPYDTAISRQFNNVLPFMMFRYAVSKDKNLRVVYRTNTNLPSVDQLQNVLNNTNPLLLSMGNPDLKQSFQNNVFVRYSATNAKKGTSFFAMIGGSQTLNQIGNSSVIATTDTIAYGIFLRKGSQLSRPVNMDGAYNLRSFINYALPITKLKCNLNLNAGVTFSHSPGLINGRVNYSNSPALSGGLVLSSNISPNLDFTLSTNSSYSIVSNTLNTSLNSTYFNQLSQFKIKWIFAKGFVITTDVTHTYYTGLSAGFNQNFLLLNGGIGYKFMKDDVAEIMLSTFDALKQNNAVTRNVTDTYIEDLRSNVLQRYFMLTFTYNIRKFKIDENVAKP